MWIRRQESFKSDYLSSEASNEENKRFELVYLTRAYRKKNIGYAKNSRDRRLIKIEWFYLNTKREREKGGMK